VLDDYWYGFEILIFGMDIVLPFSFPSLFQIHIFNFEENISSDTAHNNAIYIGKNSADKWNNFITASLCYFAS